MTNEELQALLTQADELNKTRNFDEAIKVANEVLSELNKDPTEPHLNPPPKGGLSNSSPTGEVRDGAVIRTTALLTLADSAWLKSDYDTALILTRTSLTLAEEYKLPDIKARCWNTCGNVYADIGSYDKALEFYEQALALNMEIGLKSGVAIVTQNLGNLYSKIGSNDKALEFYEQALALNKELDIKSGVAIVARNIASVYADLGSNAKALEFYEQALTLSKELGLKLGVARVTGSIGSVYYSLGYYEKTLEYYHNALAAHEELGDRKGVARVTGNIGNVYYNLGTYEKALEYYQNGLAAHKELGDKSSVAAVTGNIGIVYMNLGSYEKALEYYHNALAALEELGDKTRVALVTGNIGIVYDNLGSYDQALEYYHNALAAHEELGDKSGVARVTGNIGSLLADKKYECYDAVKAEEYLLKAIVMCTEIGANDYLLGVYKALSELYENEGRGIEALAQYKKHIETERALNIEEVKKQNEQREREKEIELAKAKADAKHQATEQLLHNVLPPSIANKMLDGSKLIAEKIPSVSVLFADIVGFTKLSQRITPEELVEGLDRIFSTFDALAEKHGLEKIKTIGDAYMAVCGAPVQREDHAEAMANFAFEMVEAMPQLRSITTSEEIQLRIGIHTGEVVAGVIGKKKFAYDLWGDAVNTASRMESHGEPGKIHCTEEFMRALSPMSPMSLQFVERGEMAIKGKGLMKTYFLESKK